MRPKFEIASVLRRHWEEILCAINLNSWQRRTLNALRICRTVDLGGHIDKCGECGHLQLSYNSCRNRHCPKCQGNERDKWIAAREEELLPVKYFHVVFTIPDKLNGMCMAHPREMYNLLFQTSWNIIKTFGEDPKHLGARNGMFAILHTWGQNLSLHPHLHCVVPAGGLTKTGKWKHARSDGKFLFPVKAMSKVFRARFVSGLRQLITEKKWNVDKSLLESLFEKPWVVFAKQPFCDTKQVVEYLGRYTHKIAISNHRISDITNDTVSFSWKDYRHGDKKGTMTLQSMEFIRRFAMHILPKGFVRIRHFGILSSTSKEVSIETARKDLGVSLPSPKEIEAAVASKGSVPALAQCPRCKKMSMARLLEFNYRGPPKDILACMLQQNAKRQSRTRNTVEAIPPMRGLTQDPKNKHKKSAK